MHLAPQLSFLLLAFFSCILAKNRQFMVQWNSSNELFTYNKLGLDLSQTVRLLDQLTFMCPPTPSPFNGTDAVDYEYSIIYRVNRTNAERCVLPEGNLKPIGLCRPSRNKKRQAVKLVFRDRAPDHRTEFQQGHEYYFTTTSTGAEDGMSNREGGLCREKKMVLKVHVLPQMGKLPPVPAKKEIPITNFKSGKKRDSVEDEDEEYEQVVKSSTSHRRGKLTLSDGLVPESLPFSDQQEVDVPRHSIESSYGEIGEGLSYEIGYQNGSKGSCSGSSLILTAFGVFLVVCIRNRLFPNQ